MTPTVRSTVVHEAERGIRFGILAVLVVGVRRRHLGAITNALGALLFTYLPGTLEARYDVAFEPWQCAYVASAAFTHALGMLGPYDDVWWWDHVTHVHSATILGGLVHAHARNRGLDPGPRVLATIAIVGILWEFAEYVIHRGARLLDLEPILINYGADDTLLDLVFDLLGALLVLLLGDRLLRNFITTQRLPDA